MFCFLFCSPNLKKCPLTRSSQLPYLSFFVFFFSFCFTIQLRGVGKLKKIHFRKSLPGVTGSVYVTEVHEALPRCLRHADVISASLVLPCSAIVCSRSGQSRPGPEEGATESRRLRLAAPGRYCRSSASGPNRSQPGHFSHPETPGWSSQERPRPAVKTQQQPVNNRKRIVNWT